jgi:ABC-type lipoprotein release transport system permease subunit
MMLASAEGRAGAVVRGVPAASLADLPPGLVVRGALDLRGEAPLLRALPGDRVQAEGLTIGARHVVLRGAGDDLAALRALPVLAPQPGLAGVLVFDADGCRSAVAPAAGALRLQRADGDEVLREASRRPCAVAAFWEALDGPATLRWQAGDAPAALALQLRADATTIVVVQGDAAVLVPPPAAAPPETAAALCLVNLGETPSALRLAGAEAAAGPGSASAWLVGPGTLPAITLGVGLAERLGVALGDEVRAVSPTRADGDGGRAVRGGAGRFRVAAVVQTGFHDHDQRLALVDFHVAQRFLGRGDAARWVDVRIDDPLLARERIPKLLALLDGADLHELLSDVGAAQRQLDRITGEVVPGLEVAPEPSSAVALVDNWLSGVRALRQARSRQGSLYRVLDWEEMNRNIFDAARMQKVAMSLFPFIIVLIAALNVVGTQAVVVHERARDIGILRAMGARRRSIALIFLVQGLAVGVVGTLLGLLVGGLCCLLLDRVGYPLDPHVYLIARLPVQIEAFPFVLAGVSAVGLCFGAALVAARRAASRPPVEGLRRLD